MLQLDNNSISGQVDLWAFGYCITKQTLNGHLVAIFGLTGGLTFSIMCYCGQLGLLDFQAVARWSEYKGTVVM